MGPGKSCGQEQAGNKQEQRPDYWVVHVTIWQMAGARRQVYTVCRRGDQMIGKGENTLRVTTRQVKIGRNLK